MPYKTVAEKKARDHAYYLANREKILARHASHKDRTRDLALLRKYDITLADYDQMYINQEGKCAVCKTPGPNRGKSQLHVDHNPLTGAVRELLCLQCNAKLGYIERPRLEFVQYLDRHRKTPP